MQTQLSLFNTEREAIYSDDIVHRQLAARAGRWAVIQAGDPIVWGIGNSSDEAIGDAHKALTDWGKTWLAIEDRDDVLDAINSKELILAPCSRQLFYEVKTYGGDLEETGIEMHQGQAYLASERS